MPRLVGEADELVLNARTVTRPTPSISPLYIADLWRLARTIWAVSEVVCVIQQDTCSEPGGHPAAFAGLFHVEQILRVPGVMKGKQRGARSPFCSCIFENRCSAQAIAAACRSLAAQLDAGLEQTRGKGLGAEIPKATTFVLVLPDMHQTPQECSGGHHQCPAEKFHIQIGAAADDFAIVDDQPGDGRLKELRFFCNSRMCLSRN